MSNFDAGGFDDFAPAASTEAFDAAITELCDLADEAYGAEAVQIAAELREMGAMPVLVSRMTNSPQRARTRDSKDQLSPCSHSL